ncbi:hypothetical protein [Clostridium sp. OS1-26]|uniref:hypothetical protein n=1 Tax=Clostridium sp. OS1-26 TaxID=3070681 RepID=UPI0027E06BB8|nr:hypothetical protein [Clostridium sp. OS1-26]WML35661.1 hypothetical protein RCG18_02600 [Clostridium sp. OS1-26]
MEKCEDIELLNIESKKLFKKCKTNQSFIKQLIKIDSIINASFNRKKLIKEFIGLVNNHFIAACMGGYLILNKNSRGFYRNNCRYFKQTESYTMLLGYFAIPLGKSPTIGQYKIWLDEVLKFLNAYKESNGNDYNLISEKVIIELLKLITVEKALKVITKRRSLSILNFNLVNEKSNSVYLAHINTIINSRSKYTEGHSDISVVIFLHEVGHALHIALTRNVNIFPDGFDLIFEKAFHNKWDIVEQQHRPEVFADCFTVACCLGTKFEANHYLISELGSKSSEIIKTYFDSIIEEKISLSNIQIII